MTARSAVDAQVPKSEIQNPKSEMTHETLARAVREIYGITDLPRCTTRPETRNDDPTEQLQQNHEKQRDRAPHAKSKIENPKSPAPVAIPHSAFRTPKATLTLAPGPPATSSDHPLLAIPPHEAPSELTATAHSSR